MLSFAAVAQPNSRLVLPDQDDPKMLDGLLVRMPEGQH